MDVPTALILAAAATLALKSLTDLADRRLAAERVRLGRERERDAEVPPDLGVAGDGEVPPA